MFIIVLESTVDPSNPARLSSCRQAPADRRPHRCAAGRAPPSRRRLGPPFRAAVVVAAALLAADAARHRGGGRTLSRGGGGLDGSSSPVAVAPSYPRRSTVASPDPRHPVVRPRTSALLPSRSVAAVVFFFPICDRVCVPIAHRRRLVHHRHRLRQHRLPHLLRLCCRRGLRRNRNACLCRAPSSARRPTSARLRHHRSGGSTFDIAFAIVVFASHAVGLINRSREPPS